MRTRSEQDQQAQSCEARSFVYRYLAQAMDYPTEQTWAWLAGGPRLHILAEALTASSHCAPPKPMPEVARPMSWEPFLATYQDQTARATFESVLDEYIATFGHAARGPCPINEIEYGDLKADPLFQPHRLADLAAFYRAFGLELTDDASERQDHLSIELEFMAVLAAKESWAWMSPSDEHRLAVGQDAQRQFLREHLGRWTPAFFRRLARANPDGWFAALSLWAERFVEQECHRAGVAPGREDLLLRPVDAGGESLCTSCGLGSLPPGASIPLMAE